MPGRLRRARFGAVAVATLALVLILPGCSSRPKRFFLVGDSLADAAKPYWEKDMTAHGAVASGLTIGGTAVCNLLPDLPKVLAFHPDAVVVSYLGNLLPPCLYPPGTKTDIDALVARNRSDPKVLVDKYRADTEEVVRTLTRRHIRVYLVMAPRPRSDTALADGVAANMRAIARASSQDLVRLIDGGRLIAPNRRFAATQPCLRGEPCVGPVVNGVGTNPVRYEDGTHFDCQTPKDFFAPCLGYSSGASRYAADLSEPLIRDYHLRS